MTRFLFLAVALATQRALGWPGAPPVMSEVLLPMVWIVGPPLRARTHSPWFLALLIGLAWDLLMEPVLGPGGIAWCAAALGVDGIAGVVADRSPKAWFALGAVGAVLVLVVRHLAVLPLGLGTPLDGGHVFRCMALTALWCGLAGWTLKLDLPSRWQQWRARRLR